MSEKYHWSPRLTTWRSTVDQTEMLALVTVWKCNIRMSNYALATTHAPFDLGENGTAYLCLKRQSFYKTTYDKTQPSSALNFVLEWNWTNSKSTQEAQRRHAWVPVEWTLNLLRTGDNVLVEASAVTARHNHCCRRWIKLWRKKRR